MKTKIAVSACLLGQNVRYDGKNKAIDLSKLLNPDEFELIAICAEVEMGLLIPREPMERREIRGEIRLVQVNDHSISYNKQFKQWFENNKQRFMGYSGFILKSKSPSCGSKTTPHFSGDNFELSDGLFVQQLRGINPNIVLIDEIQLKDKIKFKQFILKINSPLEK